MAAQRRDARFDRRSGAALLGIAAGLGLGLGVLPARAERIENTVAVFSALDKVTARISKFEVPLNSTIKFGALKVTPRVCFTRPTTEQPKTTSFVEVDEIDEAHDQSVKRIFTGWMFAESPGLNAVEHPVFDVWLTDCQQPKTVAAKPSGPDGGMAGAKGETAPAGGEPAEPRRRVRR